MSGRGLEATTTGTRKKRFPAYTIRIRDLANMKVVGETLPNSDVKQFRLMYFEQPIYRVAIFGTIVKKDYLDDIKGEFDVLYVDDGTGAIRIYIPITTADKDATADQERFSVWQDIFVVGRPFVEYITEEQEAQLGIKAELWRVESDLNWELVHRLQAIRTRLFLYKTYKESTHQEVVGETSLSKEEFLELKEQLLNIIAELDEGEGVAVDVLLKTVNLDPKLLTEIIDVLYKDGTIYKRGENSYSVA